MGILFEHIKKYLINNDNVWINKSFLKRMGDEWVNKLHFEIATIEFEANNPNIKLATYIWVYIPLPNCNDEWSKNSFKLAENLISNFSGYYDWNAQYLYNKKVNRDIKDIDIRLYLSVCIKNPNKVK